MEGHTCASGFSPNDGQLHVLDLDPHEEEVNLADDNVLEVVPGANELSTA